MLYNIKTGRNVDQIPMNEIAILVASLRKISAAGIQIVFTDRHAKLATARFSANLDNLDWIDWDIIDRSDFAYDPNDPGKMERYQAEALVHQKLRLDLLEALICCEEQTKLDIEAKVEYASLPCQIAVSRRHFF